MQTASQQINKDRLESFVSAKSFLSYRLHSTSVTEKCERKKPMYSIHLSKRVLSLVFVFWTIRILDHPGPKYENKVHYSSYVYDLTNCPQRWLPVQRPSENTFDWKEGCHCWAVWQFYAYIFRYWGVRFRVITGSHNNAQSWCSRCGRATTIASEYDQTMPQSQTNQRHRQ